MELKWARALGEERPARKTTGGETSGGTPFARRTEEDRLHGWKEIAAYLRHGVRTVQRWERTEGLPVSRHAHEKRDAVYAYRSELDAWWKERTARMAGAAADSAGRPLSGRLALGYAAWWLWVPAAAAFLLTGLWIGLRARAPGGLHPGDSVLIADFENHTGNPIFDRSLWEAFSIGLKQSSRINIVSRARMERALERMGKKREEKITAGLGQEIGLREGARLVIACAIGKLGSEYVITARLIQPESGEELGSQLVRARNEGAVLGALSTLTGRIRRSLGEAVNTAQGPGRPLPMVTTPSLDALKAYADGVTSWGRGRYREAVASYRSAVALDPGFAMAHAALAGALLSHVFYEPGEARKHFEEAMRHPERITERERLFIQAAYHAHLNHIAEAVRLYEELLRIHPEDVSVLHNLGTLLMHNERPAEAEVHLREAARLAPSGADTILNLATVHRQLGRRQEALREYGRAFELEPEWIVRGNINHEYGFGLADAGNCSGARKVFLMALARPEMKSSALRSLALLDMYEGRHRDAEGRLREAIALNQSENQALREARNRLYLAMLLEARGDRAGELRELRRAGRAALKMPAVWVLSRIGVLQARAGSAAEAESMHRQAAALADPQNGKDSAELHLLEAEIEAARGRMGRAIQLLRMARSESATPLTLAALAALLRRADLHDEAIDAYEGLLTQGHLAIGWEPQQAWLAAHAELAELYLMKGDRARAAKALAPLSRLWAGADRELPLTQQIARLEARLAQPQPGLVR